jgi:hypothetical protein
MTMKESTSMFIWQEGKIMTDRGSGRISCSEQYRPGISQGSVGRIRAGDKVVLALDNMRRYCTWR